MVVEPPYVKSPIPKPPRQNPPKEKKSSTIDGLLRIVNDHSKRAETHSNTEKQTNENISYFRVAKSRCGKFETDGQGFVNNSIAIFDSTNQPKSNPPSNKNPPASQLANYSSQTKPTAVQQQTKGKQAYSLLKRYEKEEEEESQSSDNTDYLKINNNKEKSPSPPVQVGFFSEKKPINFSFLSWKLPNEPLISQYAIIVHLKTNLLLFCSKF